MDFDHYRSLLIDRLLSYFDILESSSFPRWNLAARHSARLNQTFLGKSNVVDYMESSEWCFVRNVSCLSERVLFEEITALKTLIPEIVTPSRHHKSTRLISVLAVPSLELSAQTGQNGQTHQIQSAPHRIESARALRSLKRFRSSCPHRFYFHGWTELGIAVVDLSTGAVIASPAAKALVKTLTPKQ